jgi:hypothetical protein
VPLVVGRLVLSEERTRPPADFYRVTTTMGRAPCCEKVGLKRGRWTEEEDEILASYIAKHGEGSWRSLPKNAGKLILYTPRPNHAFFPAIACSRLHL